VHDAIVGDQQKIDMSTREGAYRAASGAPRGKS